MQHHVYESNALNEYPIAILVKESAFSPKLMYTHYVEPLIKEGIPKSSIILIGVRYDSKNKAPVKLIKEELTKVLSNLKTIKTETILVADPSYFKVLTKLRKSEPHHGYIKPCLYEDNDDISAILSVNYQALFHNPTIIDRLQMSLDTLIGHYNGCHLTLGHDVIHTAQYPEFRDIKGCIERLHQHDVLTCDIETRSLDFWNAGISTIAFAWDKHNGLAFPVDRGPSHTVLKWLKEFFETYKGKIIYHNAGYDIKIIIYRIFMQHLLDTRGLIHGLKVMYRDVEDTKLITYLATNTCSKNKLSLKYNAFEYTGNYALDDIENTQGIEMIDLLEYNLIDCLATWYVYEKYRAKMVNDNQEQIYNEIFIPSMRVITHMELVGMPMRESTIEKTDFELKNILWKHTDILQNTQLIQNYQWQKARQNMIKENLLLKRKVKPLEDFLEPFNPASPIQVRAVVYDIMGFPVEHTTATKLPSTGNKALKVMLKRLENKSNLTAQEIEYQSVLKALVNITDVSIILDNFMKAFKHRTINKNNGCVYLHGNFNLGGTVTGRLSSSDPNLQNIPSSSTYAKHVKSCFIAPPGWIMIGADFSSLEDRISALTTKDPNKIKVYTEGYDGHCLRAFSYFNSQMPDITDTVASINSIETKYPALRQKSKGPTFALTYQGTWRTLVKNIGFEEEEAIEIDKNYHKLYKVSDDWIQDKIKNACRDGYTDVAFGLRVRTPVLGQCVYNPDYMPYEAQAEGRTMGNAHGQSYGLLNNRASIEFQERLFASAHVYDVLPIAHIHDAQYFIIKNDLETIKWVNDNLIECMEWQGLPEIAHPKVKLGGALGIHSPTWAQETKIPNNATTQEIQEALNNE